MPTGEPPSIDEAVVEETPVEEPSTPEQTVPITRFKEVYKKTKELEEEIGTLKAKPGETLTPEQQKEQQAKSYLKGLVKEEREEAERLVKEAEKKEQATFESEVDDTLAVHTDVDRQEFLKFIETKGDEYGVTSVKGAMKLYKDLGQIKSDTAEETKETMGKKPNLPKSEAATHQETPPDDSKKSYDEILREAETEAEERSKK